MTQNEARFQCIEYIQTEKEEHKAVLMKFTAAALTILAVSLCALTLCPVFGLDVLLAQKIVLVVNGLNAIFYVGAAWPRFEGIKNCNTAAKHLEEYGYRGDCIALLKKYQMFRQ